MLQGDVEGPARPLTPVKLTYDNFLSYYLAVSKLHVMHDPSSRLYPVVRCRARASGICRRQQAAGPGRVGTAGGCVTSGHLREMVRAPARPPRGNSSASPPSANLIKVLSRARHGGARVPLVRISTSCSSIWCASLGLTYFVAGRSRSEQPSASTQGAALCLDYAARRFTDMSWAYSSIMYRRCRSLLHAASQ